MPKMKTNRGAAKRFTLTGTGKVKRRKQNRRHILTKKAPGRKRQLRKTAYLTPADAARITRLINH